MVWSSIPRCVQRQYVVRFQNILKNMMWLLINLQTASHLCGLCNKLYIMLQSKGTFASKEESKWFYKDAHIHEKIVDFYCWNWDINYWSLQHGIPARKCHEALWCLNPRKFELKGFPTWLAKHVDVACSPYAISLSDPRVKALVWF